MAGRRLLAPAARPVASSTAGQRAAVRRAVFDLTETAVLPNVSPAPRETARHRRVNLRDARQAEPGTAGPRPRVCLKNAVRASQAKSKS